LRFDLLRFFEFDFVYLATNKIDLIARVNAIINAQFKTCVKLHQNKTIP